MRDRAVAAALARAGLLGVQVLSLLVTAMQEATRRPGTRQRELRACLHAAGHVEQFAGRVACLPPAMPDDDPPEVVRDDAEARELAGKLRAEAERVREDLAARLRRGSSRSTLKLTAASGRRR